MNEKPGRLPFTEFTLTPDRDPLIKDTWVKGFIDGNKRWPEETRGIAIYTAAALLQKPPISWPALLRSPLSDRQLIRVGAAANREHRLYKVKRAVDTPEKPIHDDEHLMKEGRLGVLWHDVVHTTVIDSISRYRDSVRTDPKDPRRPQMKKAEEIQDFFLSPHAKPHIDLLTTAFTTAQEALETDDSIAISDDYKLVLSQKTGDEDAIERLRNRYTSAFPNREMGEDDPGRWAWELAATNVRGFLEMRHPSHDFRWLTLSLQEQH